MKCPECGAIDDRVIDSRLAKENTAIRRRRECLACKHRFTTYETVEESLPLVVKKDERREAFDRRKIIEGMRRACEKRPVTFKQIESVAEAIEQELVEKGDKEVAARYIGDRVMDELRRIDEVAYVRFASVYRSFKAIDEFIVAVEQLSKSKESELQAFSKNGPRDEGQGIQDSP